MARPRKHDRAKLMLAVCERMAKGELVKDAAKAEGVSANRIREWALEEPFAVPYARAREAQAHAIAEGAIALADKAVGMSPEGVQARRLQVDARKWLASKIAPRFYADRLDVTSDNKPLAPTQTIIIGGHEVKF